MPNVRWPFQDTDSRFALQLPADPSLYHSEEVATMEQHIVGSFVFCKCTFASLQGSGSRVEYPLLLPCSHNTPFPRLLQ